MPRITPKDAEGLLAAYAKVHAPKEESAPETNTEITSSDGINVDGESSE